jgi:hypothetical protein
LRGTWGTETSLPRGRERNIDFPSSVERKGKSLNLLIVILMRVWTPKLTQRWIVEYGWKAKPKRVTAS